METIGTIYCDECGGAGYHLQGCRIYEEGQENDAGEDPSDFSGTGQLTQAGSPIPEELAEGPSPTSPPALHEILRRTAVDLLQWAARKIEPANYDD